MSYDLDFRSSTPLTIDELKQYFADLPNFSVSDRRAHYENEDTGVYFGFDFTDEPDPGNVPVAFNMNYYRPHTFGLEAEPVLASFVRHFALHVVDPQGDGMGEGPYSSAGFLRGWNHGNRFAHRAILSQHDAKPLTLPAAKLEGIWRWNMAKEVTQDHMTDLIGDAPPCFVPTVKVFQVGETEVQSIVIWDVEIAVALPDVDLVVTTNTAGESVAMPPKDVLGVVTVHSEWRADYAVGDGLSVGLRTWLIDELPRAATKKLRAAMRPFQPLGRPGLDQVLDAELVAEARVRTM